MGEKEIEDYLSYLAIKCNVSHSTQNQALNSLIFLFKNVLDKDTKKFTNIRRAKRTYHIPAILIREEIHSVLTSFRKGS